MQVAEWIVLSNLLFSEGTNDKRKSVEKKVKTSGLCNEEHTKKMKHLVLLPRPPPRALLL